MSGSMFIHLRKAAGLFQTDMSLPLWRLYQKLGLCYKACMDKGYVFDPENPIDEHSMVAFEREDYVGLFVRSSEYTVIFLITSEERTVSIRVYDVYDDSWDDEERNGLSEYEAIKYGCADLPWTEYPSRPGAEYFVDRYKWNGHHNCTPILTATGGGTIFDHKVLEWEHGRDFPEGLMKLRSTEPAFSIGHLDFGGLERANVYFEGAMTRMINDGELEYQERPYTPEEYISESLYYYGLIITSELDPILNVLCKSSDSLGLHSRNLVWKDGNLCSYDFAGFALETGVSLKGEPGLSDTAARMATINGIDEDAVIFGMLGNASDEWIEYGQRAFLALKAYLEKQDAPDPHSNLETVNRILAAFGQKAA